MASSQNLLIKLAFGGAMWDKPTGILRISGLSLPMTLQPTLGDEVTVELAGIHIDVDIVVTGWVCTPNGYQFTGEKNYSPEITGRVMTQFTCRSLYFQEMGINPLKDAGYDDSVLREVETPWPNHRQNYYMLDEAIADLSVAPSYTSGISRPLQSVNWSIPRMANTPIASIDIQGYARSAPKVGSMINGANLLYFVDGFTNTVNKIDLTPRTPKYGSISIAPRFGNEIIVHGGVVDPTADPRSKDAPNSLWGECREEVNISNVYSVGSDKDDSTIIRVVAPETWREVENTGKVYGVYLSNKVSPWATLGTMQSTSWTRPWGLHDGDDIPDLPNKSSGLVFFENLFGSSGWGTWYDKIKELVEKTYALYGLWYKAAQHTKEKFHFVNLAPWSNPSIYSNPFIEEELAVDAHKNDFYEHVTKVGGCEQYQLNWAFKGLRERWHCEECGDPGKNPEPDIWTQNLLGLFSADNKLNLTFFDTLDPEKTSQNFFQKKLKEVPQPSDKPTGCPAMITVTHTKHQYEELCEGEVAMREATGTNPSVRVDKKPFLIKRTKSTETTYRCTPLVLNFNSAFWQQKLENVQGNPWATDASNQRIWLAPQDGMEAYAQNMIAGKVLRDLWCPTYNEKTHKCDTPLSNEEKWIILGSFANLQGTFDNHLLYGWVADLVDLEFDPDVVSQWKRYFSDKNNWGMKPLWTLIANAFAVSEARAMENMNVSIGIQSIIKAHPSIKEKINEKAAYFLSSLGLDEDGLPTLSIDSLTNPLHQVWNALDWIVENGYAINRICNPIPINMVETHYSKMGQTIVTSNIITGDISTVTRSISNSHLLYLDPQSTTCTTDEGDHDDDDSITRISANIHDWGLLDGFKSRVDTLAGKTLYYINESRVKSDLDDGWALAMQWKADKNVRTVRLNVSPKDITTVGRNYIAVGKG